MPNYQQTAIEIEPGSRIGIDCRNACKVVVHLWGEGTDKDDWNNGAVALKASGVNPRQSSSGFSGEEDPEAALYAADKDALWGPFQTGGTDVSFDGTNVASLTLKEDVLPPFLLLEESGLDTGHKIYGTVTVYPKKD